MHKRIEESTNLLIHQILSIYGPPRAGKGTGFRHAIEHELLRMFNEGRANAYNEMRGRMPGVLDGKGCSGGSGIKS